MVAIVGVSGKKEDAPVYSDPKEFLWYILNIMKGIPAAVELAVASGVDVRRAELLPLFSDEIPAKIWSRAANEHPGQDDWPGYSASMYRYHYIRRHTLLHIAAASPHPQNALDLLKYGVKPDAVSAKGTTPLMLAALCNHAEVVEALLAAGASVNAVDKRGNTPLHYAAQADGSRCTELLLKAGAIVDQLNKAGATALDLAVRTDTWNSVRLLLQAGAYSQRYQKIIETALAPLADADRAFLDTLRKNDTDEIVALLRKGANVNAVDLTRRESPLSIAAAKGNVPLVRSLLAFGADPTIMAPVWAAVIGCMEMGTRYETVVSELLQAGADGGAYVKGTPALFWAAGYNMAGIVRLLFRHGVDAIPWRNHVFGSETPMDWVVGEPWPQMMALFAAHEADVVAGVKHSRDMEFFSRRGFRD